MPVTKATTSYREGRGVVRRAEGHVWGSLNSVWEAVQRGDLEHALFHARRLAEEADDLIAGLEMMGAALR